LTCEISARADELKLSRPPRVSFGDRAAAGLRRFDEGCRGSITAS
jgi:hypothetical protein